MDFSRKMISCGCTITAVIFCTHRIHIRVLVPPSTWAVVLRNGFHALKTLLLCIACDWSRVLAGSGPCRTRTARCTPIPLCLWEPEKALGRENSDRAIQIVNECACSNESCGISVVPLP